MIRIMASFTLFIMLVFLAKQIVFLSVEKISQIGNQTAPYPSGRELVLV